MKTRIASLLVLAATLSTLAFAPAASAATNKAAYGFPISQVVRFDNSEIARGTSEMTVLRLLGSAPEKLSPNVWVYRGFHPKTDVTAGNDCNKLVVTFTDGKVSDLKIVNDSAVRVIAANAKKAAQTTFQIAKK
ncbi:MAG TPA: hypothetical protein VHO24_06845 [Opitutaceae bacterium]|nr:hypothetical protein [Opitutaceae bacterium]